MPLLAIDMDTPWGFFEPQDYSYDTPWVKNRVQDYDNDTPWARLEVQDVDNDIPWAELLHADADQDLPWIKVYNCDRERILPWFAVMQCNRERILPWFAVIQCDRGRIVPWSTVIQCDRSRVTPWATTLYCDHDRITPWSITQPFDYYQDMPWCRQIQCDHDFFTPYVPGVPGPGPDDPPIPTTPAFPAWVIPWNKEPRVILIPQNVIVIRVSDSEPVNFLNLLLSCDLESFAWSFSGSVASLADASLISPEAGPVKIKITINGYVWRILVESITSGHRYGDGSYSVSGVSPSVVMAEPYAKPITRIFADGLSSWASMNAQLETGWSLESPVTDWQAELDWPIPAYLFSVQNQTPIQIISRIAKSMDWRVQTHPWDTILSVIPRVPITPADWPTATPDELIMASELFTKSVKWEPAPKYNYVVVSGETQGVMVHVKRSGTTYDTPMDPVIDRLLCDSSPNPATERGRNLLDQYGYDKSVITLETPLPGSTSGLRPGLLTPGKLVEVEDLWSTWRGLVRSLSVSVDRVGVTQRAEVERYHVA